MPGPRKASILTVRPNVDLHLHTVFSDGQCQPDELVTAIAEQGLSALAVTDHDTTESLSAVQKAAEATGMTVIPGIEINTVWQDKEVHILGYFIDPEDASLQAVIRHHQDARVSQMKEMAQRLKKLKRIDISFEDIRAASGHNSIGRPHVAKVLVEKGTVTSISEAFNRYLNPRCETFVRRKTVPPHEAVEAIYESGGIPVIAHPGDMEKIEDLTLDLMNYGLRGLEAYHRSHSPALIEFHCSLAEKHGLIVTGGTDFHGTADVYGKALERVNMPEYVYEELKNEHQQRKQSVFKAS